MTILAGVFTLPLKLSISAGSPPERVRLVDASGSWDWAEPGMYGLSDDGFDGWAWSATPQYRLDPAALTWLAV